MQRKVVSLPKTRIAPHGTIYKSTFPSLHVEKRGNLRNKKENQVAIMARMILIFLLLFSFPIYGLEKSTASFSGTLLSYYSENAERGSYSIQPYFLYSSYYGSYDKNWGLQKQKKISELELFTSLQIGITHSLDLTFYSTALYTQIGNQHSMRYGDTEILLGFQLLGERARGNSVDLRLLVGGSIPTGKYDQLNPYKQCSDQSGSGVYEWWSIWIIQKAFRTHSRHPFTINLNLQRIYSVTKAGVEGFNGYGGGFGTKGTAKVGRQFFVTLACNLVLDPHWQMSLDLQYQHQNRSTFTGKRGVNQKGLPAFVGLPSSEQYSMAPALSYVYNESCGLSGGIWFTLFGRNTLAFFTTLFTFYYSF